MFDSIIQQLDHKLSNELLQHIRWQLMVTKDTCYNGKVLKIIATNRSKDEPERNAQIDIRYRPEQILICIPLQNPSINSGGKFNTVEEFSDYFNTQIYLAVQAINDIFKQ